eukprot:TRINITY_DN3902_c0_g2_i7.p1 TRINITY_DN3902_c0_g2~~TRINITY_DN3902_c0_g2_i7.p1  ORF type:complete len:282 (-),score=59.34 TRINITY_DN3902_c0_g2_i7:344-1189(-)
MCKLFGLSYVPRFARLDRNFLHEYRLNEHPRQAKRRAYVLQHEWPEGEVGSDQIEVLLRLRVVFPEEESDDEYVKSMNVPRVDAAAWRVALAEHAEFEQRGGVWWDELEVTKTQEIAHPDTLRKMSLHTIESTVCCNQERLCPCSSGLGPVAAETEEQVLRRVQIVFEDYRRDRDITYPYLKRKLASRRGVPGSGISELEKREMNRLLRTVAAHMDQELGSPRAGEIDRAQPSPKKPFAMMLPAQDAPTQARSWLRQGQGTGVGVKPCAARCRTCKACCVQ